MIPATTIRPLGDPEKAWWTYADLDVVFGIGQARRRMKGWEARGFPAPMPWSQRERRWKPSAVLGWKARQEALLPGNAAPAPHLQLVPERRA
jgi:hypothetical protein